ncbi:MAG: hypothetical protein JWQ25_164, partial [Daejeonella sp.]|nr:hypothetical protein [Daejeonella sp.]
MKIHSLVYCAALAVATFASCKKGDIYGATENVGNFSDTTGSLKSLVNFPTGMAVEYPLALSNAQYWGTVGHEANIITFGNELKNSSIVKADGTYDFSTADAFLAKATSAGLQVFGHTLVWHSQQRASYYNSLIGGGGSGGSSAAPNLMQNSGFETAATNGDIADGWQALNGGTQFSITTASVNGGTKALQAAVPAGGQNYNTQIVNRTPIAVTAGKTYTISYYVKGASAQNVQFEVRASNGAVDYQGGKPATTSFAKVFYNYTVPAAVTTIQVAFDLGGTANTIYIDDVSVVDANYVAPSSNIAINPGFEAAATNGDVAEGWQALNGASQFSITTSNVNSGTKALQAVVPAGGQNYNTQIVTRAAIPVTAGNSYNISYYAKGASAQNIQFEVRASGGAVDYQGGKPVTTSYSKITYAYKVPAGVTSIQLAFDLGGTANTIYIDDITIADASIVPPPSSAALAGIVDEAMKKHIQTVVTHYTGKIKAWDVINEPFTDGGGDLRNNINTPSTGRTDVFVWQNYLGREYATKAFQYARAADATADLFMNDFNLESDAAKVDAFVKLAGELKTANAGITGVGTQMHIDLAKADYGLIAKSFEKLASTGLKVRISELDIRINGKNAVDFVPSELNLRLQAAMYKFVIDSYIKYVPAEQRAGITFWGVHDS